MTRRRRGDADDDEEITPADKLDAGCCLLGCLGHLVVVSAPVAGIIAVGILAARTTLA